MRILLVHNYYRGGAPGGEDIVFDSERELLESAGVEVKVYTRRNDEMDEHALVDRLKTAASLFGWSRTQDDLTALFKTWRPDVVHVHNLFPLIGRAVFDVCDRFDIPSVQTIHNYRWICAAATHLREGRLCTDCQPQRLSPAIQHRCYRGSLPGSVAVTHAIRREFSQRRRGGGATRYLALTRFAAARMVAAGIDPARIRIRPNFIDLPRSDEPRERYAVFAGKLSPEKGWSTLLAAWQTLPDIPLRIVGDGPSRPQLEAELHHRAIHHVTLMGLQSREHTRRIVAGATLQVVPSEWFEGMPMVVLEAWAAGTPVIASAIGGLEEMIGHDERGLGFPPGDARALAEQVRRLWTDEPRCRHLAAAGRAHLERHHTAAMALRSLTDLYAELSV